MKPPRLVAAARRPLGRGVQPSNPTPGPGAGARSERPALFRGRVGQAEQVGRTGTEHPPAAGRTPHGDQHATSRADHIRLSAAAASSSSSDPSWLRTTNFDIVAKMEGDPAPVLPGAGPDPLMLAMRIAAGRTIQADRASGNARDGHLRAGARPPGRQARTGAEAEHAGLRGDDGGGARGTAAGPAAGTQQPRDVRNARTSRTHTWPAACR